MGSQEEVSILELAHRVMESRGPPRRSLVPYEEAYEEGFEDMRPPHPRYCQGRGDDRLAAGALARRHHSRRGGNGADGRPARLSAVSGRPCCDNVGEHRLS